MATSKILFGKNTTFPTSLTSAWSVVDAESNVDSIQNVIDDYADGNEYGGNPYGNLATHTSEDAVVVIAVTPDRPVDLVAALAVMPVAPTLSARPVQATAAIYLTCFDSIIMSIYLLRMYVIIIPSYKFVTNLLHCNKNYNNVTRFCQINGLFSVIFIIISHFQGI